MKQRIYWIDCLKVFALYLVVLGHLDFSLTHHIIYGFHMPLFFFLSGILHKNKSIKDYFYRLIIPYLLFNFGFLLLEFPWLYRSHHNFTFLYKTLWNIFTNTEDPINYPTWFLVSLFIIKVVIHFCKGNDAKIISCAFCFLVFSFMNTNQTLPWSLDRTAVGFLYFVLGMYSKRYIERLSTLKKLNKVILGICCSSLYLFLIFYVPNTTWDDTCRYPYTYLISILGILASVLIFELFTSGKHKGLIKDISIGAIAVIGFHPLCIQYARRTLQIFKFDWAEKGILDNIFLSILIMTFIAFTIPIILRYFPLLTGNLKTEDKAL